jgi:hypothetical protein
MSSSVRRTRTISVRDLTAAIDKAIATAVARSNLDVRSPTVISNGTIIGRVVRKVDINDAFRIAEEVTEAVNKVRGVTAVPALSKHEGGILLGFIDRSRSPLQLDKK